MCVQAKVVEQTELGQVGFQRRMEWRWILERGSSPGDGWCCVLETEQTVLWCLILPHSGGRGSEPIQFPSEPGMQLAEVKKGRVALSLVKLCFGPSPSSSFAEELGIVPKKALWQSSGQTRLTCSFLERQ